MKNESDVIDCPHRIGNSSKIVESDSNSNHLLSCGCCASAGKLNREKQEVATWIIDDANCENKSN